MGVPPQVASVGFAAGFGTICYGLSPGVMDKLNSVLVIGVVTTFVVSSPPKFSYFCAPPLLPPAGRFPLKLPALQSSL